MTRLRFGVARAPKSIGVLKDPENDWALNQTFSLMSEKAAETGECLYAARRIDEGNGDTWIDEWASLAARVEALGDELPAPGARLDHLHKQVLTSRNVIGGRLVDFMLGGLNYQIEHHLFPSMPRPRLRAAQPLVGQYCFEVGIPYRGIHVHGLNAADPRLSAAHRCVILVGHLCNAVAKGSAAACRSEHMSRPPADPSTCRRVAESGCESGF